MNLPKDIIYDILYFLDWKEFYKVIKYLKYDISQHLILYGKYNNSLKHLEIDEICGNSIEYLEIVKYLHSIGKGCSVDAIDWASTNGHFEIVKYLHKNGGPFSKDAIDGARENEHFEILQYLHKMRYDCNQILSPFL
jgi:hypothetical protein